MKHGPRFKLPAIVVCRFSFIWQPRKFFRDVFQVKLDRVFSGVAAPRVQLDDLHVLAEKLARVGDVDGRLLQFEHHCTHRHLIK